jgi:hypothetical protein
MNSPSVAYFAASASATLSVSVPSTPSPSTKAPCTRTSSPVASATNTASLSP